MTANQPPALIDYDLLEADPVLGEAVAREGAMWGLDDIGSFARRVGSGEVFEWGEQANVNPPRLRTHDRFGNRVDQVDFHPSWHRLMELSLSEGLHSLPFESGAGEGGRVVRDAKFALMAQVEAGHGCPVSMTTAVNYSLQAAGWTSVWNSKIVSRSYDPRFAPADQKSGLLLGMGMTERQGGSDVRANESIATPDASGGHRLHGHKWFMSAPQCDGFMVLAQAPGGLTCFLMPRFGPDGTVNPIRINRLKDKLGNRSNASSEVEFDGVWAERVGPEGEGVRTIIEMVNGTRLDCVVGSVGLMRQAVSQAGWHVAHRHAFGAFLVEKPLMQNVIADLELEVEAATLAMVRLSGAFDRAPLDPAEEAFKRLATPTVKYWVTKRCSEVVREAMECLGGNGYVEESNLPRLYRESPVNAIWEGSGNVIALDLLRAIAREPDTLEVFRNEVELAGDDRLGHRLAAVDEMLAGRPESSARRIAEGLAEALAASLLLRHGDDDVAELFLRSRIVERSGRLFGTLTGGPAPIARVATRAVPHVT